MKNEENKGSNLSNNAEKSNTNSINRDNYLWENDVHLEQARQFLYSRDSWLNEIETKFVRQSIIRKRKGEIGLSVVAFLVLSGAVCLTIIAWDGQRKASIKKVNALTQSAEANLQSRNGLDAAVDVLRARKELQGFMFGKPDKEMAEVKGSLHKVYYAAIERNRLQNRGPVYDIALSSDGKLLAVVGKKDTVFIYQVPLNNNQSSIHKLWISNSKKFEFLKSIPFVKQLLDDTESNTLAQRDSFSTEQGDVHSVAFLKISGKNFLATGAKNGTVKLWGIGQNGEVNSSKFSEIKPTNSEEKSLVSALAPNGEKLVIGRKNGTVNLWTITYNKDEDKIEAQNSQPIPLLQPDQTQKLDRIYGIASSSKGLLAILRVKDIEIWDTTKNNKIHTIQDPNNEVYSVAFTPDNELAIGKEDGTLTTFSIKPEGNNKIKLTENNNKKPITTEQGTVYSMAFSSDKKLATLGADDRVILWDTSLWDTSSSKVINIIQPQEETAPIKSMASSPDGKRLATGDMNGIVRIWDGSGKPIRRINTEQQYIWDLALSPNGKLVATVGEGDTVSIWDTALAEKLYENQKKKNQAVINVHSVAFTPDGKNLAIGRENGTVTLWKIDDKGKVTEDNQNQLIKLKEPGIVHSLAFSSDKKQLATLIDRPDQQDDQLIPWSNNHNNWTQKKPIPLSPGSAENKNVAFRSNGLLAISQPGGVVGFWDINLKTWVGYLDTQQGNISSLTYTSNNLLATAGEDGLVKLWNVWVNQPIQFSLQSSQLRSVVFSPDSTRVATIEKQNNTFKLWQISANNERKQVDLILTEASQEQNQLLKQSLDGIEKAMFSPDGNRLATIDKDGKVKLWDISGGKDQAKLLYSQLYSHETNQQSKGESEPTLSQLNITNVAFSPDGQQLATIDNIDKDAKDAKVKLWNILDGEYLHEKNQQSKDLQALKNVTNVAFSPDGKQLAIINNNIVKLWDISEGKSKKSIPTEQKQVTSIAFSPKPNSHLLVTGGEDGTLRLGNTSGKLFDQINTLQGKVKSIIFSPNSQLLATIGEKEKTDRNQENNAEHKNTLKVWLILDNKLHPFKAEQPGISSVAFNSDSTQLATAKENGSINLWQLGGDKDLDNENQLVKGVCDLVKDYLENSPDLEPSDRDLCPKEENSSGDNSQAQTSTNSSQSTENEVIATDKTSMGDKILVSSLTNPYKEFAAQGITAGDFETAVTSLIASLREKPNDPEALIYLNNARIGNHKSYTIAVPVPITGNLNGALEILRGVAQAQEEFNQWAMKQGFTPIRVLIADDHNDPNIAKQIAEELAKNSEVFGVVGHFSSGLTRAAATVYNSKGLVAISPVSTSDELSNVLAQNYVFRTVPRDSLAGKKLASHMLEKIGNKKAVVVYNSQSEYSRSLKSAFESSISQNYPEKILPAVDLSKPNFKADQTIPTEAEVLVLLPNTEELDKAIQIVKENKRKLPILAGDAVYNLKTLQEGKEQAVGMVIAVPWHIDPSGKGFTGTSKKLWRADVNWRTAMSYDAAKALIGAIKQNPDRQKITETLRSEGLPEQEKFSADGASGKVQFDNSGERFNPTIQLVRIDQKKPSGSRSGTGYDFELVKEQK